MTPDNSQPKELDVYPSPYLGGWYDVLMAAHPEIEWQAIIETNRGCWAQCAFCFWGNALNAKYRLFSVERVSAIFSWLGRHKVKYVFNADSNFGMLPQDQWILNALLSTHAAWGYPEKFRTCWGKNTTDKIYTMAKRLHDAGLDKGLTLSRQSQDPQTLINVHRSNIRLDVYAALQRRANADGVPVYSELILGMPGETEESWERGLEELLAAGAKNQIFAYHCEILPNTAMADPAYLAKYCVVTQRVPLQPIHCAISDAEVMEYDRISVGTATMPPDAWRRVTVLTWLLQLFHGMKVAFYPMVYFGAWLHRPYLEFLKFCLTDAESPLLHRELVHWEQVADQMQQGEGRAEGWGGTWWEQEEVSFLHLMAQRDAWGRELLGLGRRYLAALGGNLIFSENSRHAGVDAQWEEVVRFQLALLPDPLYLQDVVVPFATPLPIALEHVLAGENPAETCPDTPGWVRVARKPSFGDWGAYARDAILHGRKGGTTLLPWRWEG